MTNPVGIDEEGRFIFLKKPRFAKLRDKLRDWLGVSTYEHVLAQDLRNTRKVLREEIQAHKFTELVELTRRVMECERIVGLTKLPIDIRLQQLHASLKIVTSFANELQREIDKV